MYAIYRKSGLADGDKFEFVEKISLAGCNVGFIPKMLSIKLSEIDTEPLNWDFSVGEMFAIIGREDATIIIDIKPKDKKYVLLCELSHVWGFSSNTWTPALFKLKGLICDEPYAQYDKSSFFIKSSKKVDIIHTFVSFSGTISKGALSGKWTFPNPSPTNSVLLWPEALAYFMDCIKK